MTASSPRITARVNADIQELLLQAAAISGVSSINAFVLNAAVEKAKAIMEREQVLKLSKRDAMALVDALDAPARVHPRLQQAAKGYDGKTQE